MTSRVSPPRVFDAALAHLELSLQVWDISSHTISYNICTSAQGGEGKKRCAEELAEPRFLRLGF